jgi:hypothetical protein
MPPQPVDRPGLLGNELATMIEQQPDLDRLLVQIRDRETIDPVLDDGGGDRERVDLVRLARLALASTRDPDPMRRHAYDPLNAAKSACSKRRDTCRQSSIAHTRSPSRSLAHRTAATCPGSSASIWRRPRTLPVPSSTAASACEPLCVSVLVTVHTALLPVVISQTVQCRVLSP